VPGMSDRARAYAQRSQNAERQSQPDYHHTSQLQFGLDDCTIWLKREGLLGRRAGGSQLAA
jgi:hypothetical protein